MLMARVDEAFGLYLLLTNPSVTTTRAKRRSQIRRWAENDPSKDPIQKLMNSAYLLADAADVIRVAAIFTVESAFYGGRAGPYPAEYKRMSPVTRRMVRLVESTVVYALETQTRWEANTFALVKLIVAELRLHGKFPEPSEDGKPADFNALSRYQDFNDIGTLANMIVANRFALDRRWYEYSDETAGLTLASASTFRCGIVTDLRSLDLLLDIFVIGDTEPVILPIFHEDFIRFGVYEASFDSWWPENRESQNDHPGPLLVGARYGIWMRQILIAQIEKQRADVPVWFSQENSEVGRRVVQKFEDRIWELRSQQIRLIELQEDLTYDPEMNNVCKKQTIGLLNSIRKAWTSGLEQMSLSSYVGDLELYNDPWESKIGITQFLNSLEDSSGTSF